MLTPLWDRAELWTRALPLVQEFSQARETGLRPRRNALVFRAGLVPTGASIYPNVEFRSALARCVTVGRRSDSMPSMPSVDLILRKTRTQLVIGQAVYMYWKPPSHVYTYKGQIRRPNGKTMPPSAPPSRRLAQSSTPTLLTTPRPPALRDPAGSLCSTGRGHSRAGLGQRSAVPSALLSPVS